MAAIFRIGVFNNQFYLMFGITNSGFPSLGFTTSVSKGCPLANFVVSDV
jgi:hypothetical protein